MKNLLSLLFLVSFSSSAFASTYAVDRPDGGVSIVNYSEGSSDSLEDVLKAQGFSGYPVSKVEVSELPSRADRKYWKKNGNKVEVDAVKKSADLAGQADKDAKKAAALAKLKVTHKELKEALGD